MPLRLLVLKPHLPGVVGPRSLITIPSHVDVLRLKRGHVVKVQDVVLVQVVHVEGQETRKWW